MKISMCIPKKFFEEKNPLLRERPMVKVHAAQGQLKNFVFLLGEVIELSTKEKKTNTVARAKACCKKRHQVRPRAAEWQNNRNPKQPNRHSKRRNSLLQISPKKLTFFFFVSGIAMYNKHSKSSKHRDARQSGITNVLQHIIKGQGSSLEKPYSQTVIIKGSGASIEAW
jgi:hypothetical protein